MITYAQNFEDVMLERLFADVKSGFYIDVGAWDPKIHSVTQHFYDRGWRGVNVEPIPYRHQLFLEIRPEDLNLNNAVGLEAGRLRFYECPEDSALSTLDEVTAANIRQRGLTIEEYDVDVIPLADIFDKVSRTEIEFLKIDIEGFEDRILNNFDLRTYRPRALIVESTKPATRPSGFDRFDEVDAWSSWEASVLSQGYVFAHFDGLNRFYLREEDSELAARLKLPPGIFDGYTPYTEVLKLAERDADRQAKDDVIARLASEIDEVRRDREAKDDVIAKLASEIDEVRRDREAKDDVIARLQLQIQERDADRQTKDEVIARLASEVETINSHRENLLGQIHTLTRMIHDMQRQAD